MTKALTFMNLLYKERCLVVNNTNCSYRGPEFSPLTEDLHPIWLGPGNQGVGRVLRKDRHT